MDCTSQILCSKQHAQTCNKLIWYSTDTWKDLMCQASRPPRLDSHSPQVCCKPIHSFHLDLPQAVSLYSSRRLKPLCHTPEQGDVHTLGVGRQNQGGRSLRPRGWHVLEQGEASDPAKSGASRGLPRGELGKCFLLTSMLHLHGGSGLLAATGPSWPCLLPHGHSSGPHTASTVGHAYSWKVFLGLVSCWKLLAAADPSCFLETANFLIGSDRFRTSAQHRHLVFSTRTEFLSHISTLPTCLHSPVTRKSRSLPRI